MSVLRVCFLFFCLEKGVCFIFHEVDKSNLTDNYYNNYTNSNNINNNDNNIKYMLSKNENIFNKIIFNSTTTTKRRSIKENDYINREKRSYSHDRYVELMIVADSEMAKYHGDNLKPYILTLLSSVTSIYRDASIGNAINIVLVKLEIMREDEDRELYGKPVSKKLRHFCKWQKLHNYEDDSHPLHHDAAILLTREDLCRVPKHCETLGLAQSGRICDPFQSCGIVQDNGLSAAFTIAHEIGHILNIPHDDDEKCSRFFGGEKKQHIMARMLHHNVHPWSWSECSKYFITEFLDAGEGDCLLDKPSIDFYLNSQTSFILNNHAEFHHPGEIFDPDYQCELVYGPGSKICPYMPACKQLWCTRVNQRRGASGCTTQHMPWADGTPCAQNKWCLQGKCVEIESTLPTPIDGQWGPWSSFTPCTRSCGGGIQKATRECDNPKPKNNGKYCIGKRIQYRSCNTQECPPGTKDFREQQCEEFNGKTVVRELSSNVEWIPHYVGLAADSCKLYCRTKENSSYYVLRQKVIDGTPCNQETTNVCVNGQCKKAGCDRDIESNKDFDSCGVCGGDNSTCRKISDVFEPSQVFYGYNHVTLIPSGATNLEVKQIFNTKTDHNYLVLRAADGSYLLNEDFVVSESKRTIIYDNVRIDYSGSNEINERINCSKTLKKDLVIEVMSVLDLKTPKIEYSYLISTNKNEFKWIYTDSWSICNKVCNGEREQIQSCIKSNTNATVDEAYCIHNKKLARKIEACNQNCEIKWKIISESDCSSNCGYGFKTRLIACVQEMIPVWPDGKDISYHKLDDHYCEVLNAKPDVHISCHGTCFGVYWKYSDWSQCSETCGKGIQTRTAKCLRQDESEENRSICEKMFGREITHQVCEQEKCPEWKFAQWNPCNSVCGVGERHRSVWCQIAEKTVSQNHCKEAEKPKTVEKCHSLPCVGSWTTGSWSPCSGCKEESHRIVACRSASGILPDSECSGEKPSNKKSCVLPESCKKHSDMMIVSNAKWRTGQWSACSSTCGFGVRMRYVACIEGEKIVSNSWCNLEGKPANEEKCEIICNDIHAGETKNSWNVGPWGSCQWSACAKTCGYRKRSVQCLDFNRNVISDKLCDKARKPKSYRKCQQYSRKYIWQASAWSTCSSTCGDGWETRQITCHRIIDDGIIDPTPVRRRRKNGSPVNLCDNSKKPTEIRRCNYGDCNGPGIWRPGAWQTCSATCGNGFQIRRVPCYSLRGKRIARKYCDIKRRPIRKTKCIQELCSPVNCTELALKQKTMNNNLRTTISETTESLLSVYCSGIKSRSSLSYSHTLKTNRNLG